MTIQTTIELKKSVKVVVVLLFVFTPLTRGFEYEDCGADDAIVRFSNVSFSPDPLIFGDLVHVQAEMRFLQGIPGGYDRLEVFRVFNFLGFPLAFRFGCLFGGECMAASLCTTLSKGVMCEWFRGTGHKCGCPSEPILITSRDYPVHVPSLPRFVSYFVNGLYRLRWTIFNYEMKEIGCVTADINFAAPEIK